MKQTICNKNNMLAKETSSNMIKRNAWLRIENNKSNRFVSNELIDVCRTQQQDKRWILCVDGNDSDVYQLAEHLDSNKLLRVNGQHKSVGFDKIQRTLLKGNCSTVVLCDPDFTAQQLRSLQICAQRGNTKCIIVNKHCQQLH